jgi:hypothetical protein
MGRFPIFQSPELDTAEQRMRPSPTFGHGFLGNESRKLIEILNDDQKTVKSLGLSDELIAGRLRVLTERAKRGGGNAIVVDDRFEVRADAARGKIPCPWGHPGLYSKIYVVLKRIDTGETLVWSDLSLHLIEEHGFYQGKGSPYRIEPRDVKRILGL